jgi:sulfur-oxidizing protein SoxX
MVVCAAIGHAVAQDQGRHVVVVPDGIGQENGRYVIRLRKIEIVDGGIAKPLTDQPGDPARGRRLMGDRQKGGCLNCHNVPGFNSPGDLGPDLAGVASRQSLAALRLRLVDPRRIDPDARMPAFYSFDGMVRVAKAFEGKPLLQPQEIEDVLAVLETLK